MREGEPRSLEPSARLGAPNLVVQLVARDAGNKIECPPVVQGAIPLSQRFKVELDRRLLISTGEAMAESYLEPLHSPSELRREAESLLHAAIRLQARHARKGLLAGCFELVRQAQMMSRPPEVPPPDTPLPYLDRN
jgi:hypothetical protein